MMPPGEETAKLEAVVAAAPDTPSDLHFKSYQVGNDLKKCSVRSGAVTLGSQAAQFLLQIASTAILARLLVPDDFGIVAMVLSVTAFADVFRDAGLSSATIQRAELTHAQVNTMFWLNVVVGIVLTAIVAAAAPALVWFYRKPELLWVTIALSTSFFVGSLGIQHSALLNRSMRFRALAITQVVSAVVGLVAAIATALAGWGYWALVVRALASSLASVVLLWTFSNWRPGRPARADGIRSLFRFGADVTGFNVVNYFSRNFDNVLVGRVCGADALGLYSRAYSLLMLPISNLRNPLNAVALPAMSQLQSDRARYRSYFKKYASVLGFASMPIAAFLFICSDDAIRLVLGPRWDGANAIFRVLALTAFIQPINSLNGLVMVSMGQSRRYLRWGIISATLTVASFGIGVIWGPVGVALAYGIVTYALLYPSMSYCFEGTALTMTDFFKVLARPACASVTAGVLAWIARSWIPWAHAFSALAGCGTIFVVTYAVIVMVLPGGRDALREYSSYFSLLISSRLRKASSAQAAA